MTVSYDIAIVGGGLVGLAATVAAMRTGLRIVHIAPAAPPDQRTSALMMPSVRFMQEAGLIAEPEALGAPLSEIRIIDATKRLIRAPETLFTSSEAGLPAFGWNFANTRLTAAFNSALAGQENLTTIESTLADLNGAAGQHRLKLANGQSIDARLVVAADGKKSLIRQRAGFQTRENAFVESALVCDLTLGRPLGGTSVEYHYDRGPFTLVPAGGNKANLVWIDDHAVLTAAKDGGADHLRAVVQQKSQNLFGPIELSTPAFIFPLSTLAVDSAGQGGIVLVGEAAHAFPPIGAQGLNLGLRDAADLARALASNDPATPDWAEKVSADYAQSRAADLARTSTMVDALFKSLLSDFLPTQSLRAGGLWALKLLPPLRRRAFQLGMGIR